MLAGSLDVAAEEIAGKYAQSMVFKV